MNEDDIDEFDVSKMSELAKLKLIETTWQDFFQTRKQTWLALQISGLLTVAVVGIQSKEPWFIGVAASLLLMAVSLLGLQITRRHRNTVERLNFTLIIALEKSLGLPTSAFKVPKKITIIDLINPKKSNTSLFLARMQLVIHLIGLLIFVLSVLKARGA